MADISRRRLRSQQLEGSSLASPAEVVAWMGAIQAQDYAAARWAVGQRGVGMTEPAIERAFGDGSILRTHVLRPTWHFVMPTDIRWLLGLTAPRIKAASASYYRRLELDAGIFKRTHTALEKALAGGRHQTRAELGAALGRAGIATDSLRLTFLMMRAELDAVVCSGPRRGKQITYALLDERVPQARTLERDEALAELTRRYFVSHGPASVRDFVWWSGLTTADARRGLEMVGSRLMREDIDGQTYWFAETAPPGKTPARTAYLLSNYDELTVGYADRSAVFDAQHLGPLGVGASVVFSYTLLVDGQIVGTWKRTFSKGAVVVTLSPFAALKTAHRDALAAEARRYADFHGMSLELA